MKKTTISILAVLFTVMLNPSFAKSANDSTLSKKEAPLFITTLVINANVNVVLVNDDQAALEASGGKSFNKFVRLLKSGDTLTIHSTEKGYFEGTVFVPASRLRRVRINSGARVRSLFALQVPNLDVVINGDCEFSVSNIGEVTVTATEDYSFQEDRVSRKLPASIQRKKE